MSKSASRRFVLIMLCLAPLLALAQDPPNPYYKGQLKGKLMDFAGKPVASAKIELRRVAPGPRQSAPAIPAPGKKAAPLVTKTNKKGLWSFTGLESGMWELTALAEGYHPVSRKCKVSQVWDKSLVLLEAERKPDRP